jgi:hypothetical protein
VVKYLNIPTEKEDCVHMWRYLNKYFGIFKTLTADCEGWGVCLGRRVFGERGGEVANPF